jgi:hypothetical protein
VEPAVEALGLSPGVVFRPVPQLAPLDVWVARREYDQRPDVLAFMDTATEAIQWRTSTATRVRE